MYNLYKTNYKKKKRKYKPDTWALLTRKQKGAKAVRCSQTSATDNVFITCINLAVNLIELD